jgi:hypothetical protein
MDALPVEVVRTLAVTGALMEWARRGTTKLRESDA